MTAIDVKIHSSDSRLSFPVAEPLSASLEVLIREYAPYVQSLTLTILDDGKVSPREAQAEADDATQETFLAASRALGDFRGESSVKTWLTTIAINQCRGRLRKRKTHQRLQALLTNLHTLRPSTPSLEESALRADTHRHLWAAIDTLDEKHRLPVLMRYVHELPIAEIAAALGLPEGTVHSRLNHARARLKEELVEIHGT